MNNTFYAPRNCLREPIPEIFEAAHLLDRAVGAHLAGDRETAAALIAQTNSPIVREWTESMWGAAANNPKQPEYLRVREAEGAPLLLAKDERVTARMPSTAEKRSIIERFGFCCAYCGIPVIRFEMRKAIQEAYPEALPWGSTNPTQHAAFQCMWLQFDHVVPHSRGGDNSIENVVISCAPCNYGKGDRPIEEMGLIDPRSRPVYKTSWDGLERFVFH